MHDGQPPRDTERGGYQLPDRCMNDEHITRSHLVNRYS